MLIGEPKRRTSEKPMCLATKAPSLLGSRLHLRQLPQHRRHELHVHRALLWRPLPQPRLPLTVSPNDLLKQCEVVVRLLEQVMEGLLRDHRDMAEKGVCQHPAEVLDLLLHFDCE